jgi:hypothetical protein
MFESSIEESFKFEIETSSSLVLASVLTTLSPIDFFIEVVESYCKKYLLPINSTLALMFTRLIIFKVR